MTSIDEGRVAMDTIRFYVRAADGVKVKKCILRKRAC